MVLELRARDRSSAQDCSGFLGAEESPRCVRSEGLTTARAPCPVASRNIHGDEDGEEARVASLDDDRLPNGVRRNAAESVLATIFKDERDCFTKIRSSLFASVTLAIRTRDLSAERDEPVTILLDDGGELVVHI